MHEKRSSSNTSPSLHRARGENYHSYLLRVRTELRNRKMRLDQCVGVTQARGSKEAFEVWFQQKKRQEAASSDEGDLEIPCSRHDIDEGQDGSSGAEEASSDVMENNLWHQLRVNPLPDNVRARTEITCEKTSSPSLSILAPERLIEEQEPDPGFQTFPSRLLSTVGKTIPMRRSRSAVIKPFVLPKVEHDNMHQRRQLRRLSRIYNAATTHELPSAVSSAFNNNHVVNIGVGASMVLDETIRQDTSIVDGDRIKLPAHLRQRGLSEAIVRSGSGELVSQGEAKRQWLHQLAQDYPEEFCNCANTERCEDALIRSNLWVLDLHGDPCNERFWNLRNAWLNNTGCLWLGPREGEAELSTLYLGGESVANLQVLRARTGVETVATLGGSCIYPFRIDLPVARFARQKYFAAQDVETCDLWIRTCRMLLQSKARTAAMELRQIDYEIDDSY